MIEEVIQEVAKERSAQQTTEQRSNIKRHSLWLLATAVGFYVTYIIYMIVYTSGH